MSGRRPRRSGGADGEGAEGPAPEQGAILFDDYLASLSGEPEDEDPAEAAGD